MKITKYEHSCLVVEEQGKRLVIDPGNHAKALPDFGDVSAIVVTHVHPDHFYAANIDKITNQNPNLRVFTTPEVAQALDSQNAEPVKTGQIYETDPFRLEFFGGQHALVSPEYPLAENFGVLVNDRIYYPGDSVVSCPKPYTVLAAPVMGPWLKFADSFELIKSSDSQTVIPMHNGFINDKGEELYKYLFDGACKTLGKTYRWLEIGESIEL